MVLARVPVQAKLAVEEGEGMSVPLTWVEEVGHQEDAITSPSLVMRMGYELA